MLSFNHHSSTKEEIMKPILQMGEIRLKKGK